MKQYKFQITFIIDFSIKITTMTSCLGPNVVYHKYVNSNYNQNSMNLNLDLCVPEFTVYLVLISRMK